jgi:hypothetical protein
MTREACPEQELKRLTTDPAWQRHARFFDADNARYLE